MLNTILLQANDVVGGEEGEMSLSVLDLAIKGGWIIAILALLSFIAVYIFVERFLIINKATKEDRNFMNNIRDFIQKGQVDSARAMCKSNPSPIARMIEKGLSRIGRPLNDINAAIENVGKLEVSRLEKNLAGLATIAGAAPMLGFLGTVIGMIIAFYEMSRASNTIDINMLSTGIYQAMVTTVAGLIVGIVAYVMYNILVSKVEKLVFKLEARATEFMDLLHEPAK
ncbi:MAG: MotA/TolQ/ExbB proton channel family protein [Bacteroidales bacterium]|nr:MotA/TolQ/ExbB proton channel family protein [Bacteroidales bacterium]MCF8343415.1 MotA/TolQ/ExbB proton channel family protein [Bacteroidales bacterium]MCF8349855.1 MotA/TolQ/ExbB proton channel family protein [Bacteroidales bacterium]MCF8375549.1 MotA/TolQ/ExbB proton channel family protein [Bacteroidales bacterium]MCF8399948.1 MotA/TolQ/ExbB proton channel family protein [Bacteroidales bacterium]